MKYYVGIDLGGTNTKIGLLDENGEIIFSTSIKTNQEKDHNATILRIYDKLLEKCKEKEISYEDVISAGIGVPGPVVKKTTVLMWANFPWEPNINLAKEFEKILKKPVFIDNDVNVIALGEAWKGSGLGYENSVTIAFGTGVGAGVVVDGKILSSKNGASGEIGHIPLFLEKGRKCGCGKYGCLEAYASAISIGKIATELLEDNKESLLYQRKNNGKVEAKDVFECAKLGDEFSKNIVDESCKKIAFALSTTLNILDSDVIIIGGGLSLAGEFLIENIKKHLDKYLLPSILKNIKIRIAKLGNDAGIFGAAYLAISETN